MVREIPEVQWQPATSCPQRLLLQVQAATVQTELVGVCVGSATTLKCRLHVFAVAKVRSRSARCQLAAGVDNGPAPGCEGASRRRRCAHHCGRQCFRRERQT